MAKNYAIVQTIEEDILYLTVMPCSMLKKNGYNNGQKDQYSDFLGNDLMLWSSSQSFKKLYQNAKKDPTTKVEFGRYEYMRCKIKREGYLIYEKVIASFRYYSCTFKYQSCT